MSAKEHWERVHSTQRADRVSWFQRRPRLSLEMIWAAVDTNWSVIDVGGGSSTLVDNLLAGGFHDLSVLDVSGAALAASRARLGDRAGEVEWFEADIRQFEPARQWDLWHDRAVFHFLIDPADRLAYRNVLNTALRPGGQLVMATFAPDGPEKCSGLRVERYDSAKLGGELGKGWELVETRNENHVKPDGGEQSFQFSRFVRAG